MSVAEVLINAEQAAKGKFKITEGDYLDDEGLYHCGVCHRRKQTVITVGNVTRTLSRAMPILIKNWGCDVQTAQYQFGIRNA